MAYRRSPIHQFELQNAAYANASVSFFAIDPVLQTATSTLIALYDSATGTGQLPNPQVLGPDGAFARTVWAQDPYVAQVSGQLVGTHATGVVFPASTLWRGDWVAGAGYQPGDFVRDGANGASSYNIYACAVPHTSGVWVADLAAGYWQTVLDFGVARLAIGAAVVIGGLDAQKPTPGTAGRIYIATDTARIWRDTGAAWVLVAVTNWADIGGKPTTLAGFGITDAVSQGQVGTGPGQVVQLTGSGALPALDAHLLTNLPNNLPAVSAGVAGQAVMVNLAGSGFTTGRPEPGYTAFLRANA